MLRGRERTALEQRLGARLALAQTVMAREQVLWSSGYLAMPQASSCLCRRPRSPHPPALPPSVFLPPMPSSHMHTHFITHVHASFSVHLPARHSLLCMSLQNSAYRAYYCGRRHSSHGSKT